MSIVIVAHYNKYTDYPTEHVRLFVSIGGVIKSSNVTPIDDCK